MTMTLTTTSGALRRARAHAYWNTTGTSAHACTNPIVTDREFGGVNKRLARHLSEDLT